MAVVVVLMIFATPATPTVPGAAGASSTANAPPSTTPDQPDSGSAADSQAASEKPSTGAKPDQSADSRKRSGPTEFVDPSLVVRELRAAAEKARTDPAAALAAFLKALPSLTDWWPRFDIAQRRAADDAVAEFMYVVASRQDIAAQAMDELARRARLPASDAGPMSAEQIWPAAWADGFLSRMSLDRELPRPLAAAVSVALNDALGTARVSGPTSFESGALAGLRRMPRLLLAPARGGLGAPDAGTEAFKRWADAVIAATPDQAEAERTLVEGLEQVLTDGPDPEADLRTHEAIESLVLRIKWRADGPARLRMLEWFNDPRIGVGDLRVLTGALAGKSGAEGVDATMVLSISASPDDRSLLRSRYAQAWGVAESEARGKAVSTWRGASRAVVDAEPPSGDSVTRLLGVVTAVRTSEAARRIWLGDSLGASRLMDETPNLVASIPGAAMTAQPGAPAGSPLVTPGGGGGGGGRGKTPRGGGGGGGSGTPFAAAPSSVAPGADGAWAESYLRAERNIPVRLQRIAELDQVQRPIGRVDGAVLIEAACFASPVQVRVAAQAAAAKYADDPAAVEAMIELLPTAPRIRSVAELVERLAHQPLPRVGDPDWELVSRRALVERLLGLLASQSPQAALDMGTSVLAESYIRMAGTDSGPADESASDRAVRGASDLFRLWRQEAERLPPPDHPPLTLRQIDTRRAGREQIASGPIQAFAAAQTSVAEILAYIVCAERPVQSQAVAQVLTDLAARRRSADHAFVQIWQTERAVLRLWQIRFGEAPG